MSQSKFNGPLRWLLPVAMVALAACSREAAPGADADAAGTPAAASTPAVAAPRAPAVSAQVQAMSTDDLRAAASKALGENRIYAPGGDNAVEYYLALRDKQPGDPGVKSALTDLMPYTLIATEQSIGREDFEEARRLSALIEKADPKAPALPRLQATIAAAQTAVAARVVTQAERAQTDAQARVLEQQRLAQQELQQREAAAALAVQEQAATQAETARVAAAQRAAAERAAAEREAAAAAAAAAPAPTPARPATPILRVVSAPPPRYPPEALRAGTGGEVLVEITIGTDGSVTNARVVRSNPARVFDREALNAVRRWQFEPIDTVTTTRRTIAFNPG